jgi:hypothetical protein
MRGREVRKRLDDAAVKGLLMSWKGSVFAVLFVVLAAAFVLWPGAAWSAAAVPSTGLPMGPSRGDYAYVPRHGAALEGAGSAQTVGLDLDPASATVSTGQIFTIAVRIVAGSQLVDGAEAHIDFAPTHLQVVQADGTPASSIEAGGSLGVPILNTVNNALGQIDFAAGSFNELPSGTFVLATIRFKALASTGGASTPIDFVSRGGSPTDVTYQGGSVLGSATGGSVTVSGGAAGTLQDPLPIACGDALADDTAGYGSNVSEYGQCGGGFVGPEVAYVLQIMQTTSVTFTLDTTASLALLALGSPDPSDCWYMGGSLPGQSMPAGTYYLVIDGLDTGSYTLQVDCDIVVEDTPTPTTTASPTATSSPTATGTATATETSTPTPSGTVTSLPTETFTPTETDTPTETGTPTETPTPTATPSGTAWPGTFNNPLPMVCDQITAGSTNGFWAVTSDYGTCGSGFNMPEVWYSLDVAREGDIQFILDSSLSLFVFVMGSHDPSDCLGSGTTVTIPDAAPSTYYLAVDGTEYGPYTLQVRCALRPTATATSTPTATPTSTPTHTSTTAPTNTPTATHTATPTSTSTQTATPTMTAIIHGARLPIVLKNSRMIPTTPVSATRTRTATPSATRTLLPTGTILFTPTARPTPEPSPTPTYWPAGTFGDPLLAECEGHYLGNTADHASAISSYGSCGQGFYGPEVIYRLPIQQQLESLSIDFGTAADLKLFLLSQASPAYCVALAEPRSFLRVPAIQPGTYFIAVDGSSLPADYAFVVHCQLQQVGLSSTDSARERVQLLVHHTWLGGIPRFP